MTEDEFNEMRAKRAEDNRLAYIDELGWLPLAMMGVFAILLSCLLALCVAFGYLVIGALIWDPAAWGTKAGALVAIPLIIGASVFFFIFSAGLAYAAALFSTAPILKIVASFGPTRGWAVRQEWLYRPAYRMTAP